MSRHRRPRDVDAHFLRRNSRALTAAQETEDGKVTARGEIGVHHDHRSGAIGELRRVARGGRAAFIDRLERRQFLERRIGARPLVMIERDIHHLRLLCRLVRDFHLRLERNDLLGEPPCHPRRFDPSIQSRETRNAPVIRGVSLIAGGRLELPISRL